MTGGDTCAVVTGLGETDLGMEEREPIQTDPFLPPTNPPLVCRDFLIICRTEQCMFILSFIATRPTGHLYKEYVY